jgi:hypothetical protein
MARTRPAGARQNAGLSSTQKPAMPARLALLRRRLLKLAALSLTLAAVPAAPVWAQGTAAAPEPLRTVGLFSLLGDTIQITLADAPTDTRLDRNQRETMDLKDLGLDQMALRAITAGMGRLQPQAKLQMFRSTEPIPLPEQRMIADGANRAELPDWIIQSINRHNLSHVMLVTRHRGAALMRTADGDGVGRGTVEGIGFYIDPIYETVNRLTNISSRGALGAYVDIRMQLMEVSSGRVLAQHHIRDGRIYGARTDEQSLQPWNVLEPREKVEVLRTLVEENVARVLPDLLRSAGLN